MDKRNLWQASIRLEAIADSLRAKVQPGHANYINKTDAGNSIASIVEDIRKELPFDNFGNEKQADEPMSTHEILMHKNWPDQDSE